jgi:hypothetical protein
MSREISGLPANLEVSPQARAFQFCDTFAVGRYGGGTIIRTVVIFHCSLHERKIKKLINEERLPFSALQGTITDREVQQPLEIDSLYLAAHNAVFVATKNATTSQVKKFVPCKNAAKIQLFFILQKFSIIFFMVFQI